MQDISSFFRQIFKPFSGGMRAAARGECDFFILL